jgi:vacuolar-type H+-ATPase subunit H
MQNRTLKETLRQLLEAEEAGRQAAAGLEAAGDEIVRKARIEAERCAQAVRVSAEREIEELERQAQSGIDRDCKAIADETDATVERLKTQAAGRRAEAVKKVVAIPLGEEEANP